MALSPILGSWRISSRQKVTRSNRVGRTLLSAAFEFDFVLNYRGYLSNKKSKSKAADRLALSEVEGSIRPPWAIYCFSSLEKYLLS
jgi:hypothetical protein